MSERHLGLTKKVSMADIGEGWDECYAIVRLAEFEEQVEFSELGIDKLTKAEANRAEMDFVRDHFIRGEIMILDEDNEPCAAPMVPDDVSRNLEIADKLFFAILGIKLDPKDLGTEAPSKTEPTESSSTTKTTSSTASPTESPTESN